jgi:adenylate cyclase class IV
MRTIRFSILSMSRNCELKAKPASKQAVLDALFKIIPAGCERQTLIQEDAFYEIPRSTGRLKTRKINDAKWQLIFYMRPDVEGVKVSSYRIVELPSAKAMEDMEYILDRVFLRTGVVYNNRIVYIKGQTRIHLDDVTVNDTDLGFYVELETVLTPEQTPEEGNAIALKIARELLIKDCELVKGAYIDIGRNIVIPPIAESPVPVHLMALALLPKPTPKKTSTPPLSDPEDLSGGEEGREPASDSPPPTDRNAPAKTALQIATEIGISDRTQKEHTRLLRYLKKKPEHGALSYRKALAQMFEYNRKEREASKSGTA